MKLSPAGFGSSSWGAQLFAWEEMIAENEGATLVNTKAASAAKPSGSAYKFKCGIEIHNQPNAAGERPVHAGKVLLPPHFIASDNTLKLLNLTTNLLTNGPVVGWMVNTGTASQWSGVLLLPDGRYLLIPAQQPNFGYYDPWSNTVSQGVAVPTMGGGSLDYYGGGVVGQNGLVYLACNRIAVDTGGGVFKSRVQILDPVNDTLDTTTGPQLGVTTDYTSWQQFGSGHLLPDGSIFFNTRRNSAGNFGPWRCTKNADGSWVVVALDDGGEADGACLTPDGKFLVLGTRYFDFKAVRLADNALIVLKGLTSPNGASCGVYPLQDGRIINFDNQRAEVGAFDPEYLTYETLTSLVGIAGVTGVAANSTNNFVRPVPLSDGGFILLPYTNPSHLIRYTPFDDGQPIPAHMRESRYYSPR